MCWAGVVAAALMFPLVGERFVGLVAEDLAEVGDGFSKAVDYARSTRGAGPGLHRLRFLVRSLGGDVVAIGE